ncbi:MAG: glycosyltransferase family 4 protein [Chitinophagaceae bacterium]|nr:glycosyltransferase family 4 protein [Chitinophagaceae bacterium]
MNYAQAIFKRRVEAAINFPFVFIGKCIGRLFPLKNKSRHFLFFPSADIGGGPKVNADILKLLQSKSPIVIFSKKPKNNGFQSLFYLDSINVIDLHRYIDNKYFHFLNVIFRGIISSWINAADRPVIFGGECMYFYKIVQHVKSETLIVELSHLNTWINFNQAYIPFIDRRIVSTPKLKRYLEKQYTENGVPEKYFQRIVFIDNWVEIPEFMPKSNSDFNVLFVGRGAPQKRVHIISKIAETMIREGDPVSFTFVGDVSNILSDEIKQHVDVFEYITDKHELDSLYNKAHVLILTSSYEGLPIVVMDMMARARVVLSTAVDGIPDYIQHMNTGLLIDELNNEQVIHDKAIELIRMLVQNPELKSSIGRNARILALERFSRHSFEEKYLDYLDCQD